MTKLTRQAYIFPMAKGLDTNSIPGSQDVRSLTKAKNIVIRSRPSIKKRPGLRRLPYIGDDSGIQAAIQIFGNIGKGTVFEVFRVKKGRFEVLRSGSGLVKSWVDLGVQVSESDTVVFEKFSNSLVIHTQNSRPYYYTVGGELKEVEILSSHISSPPSFSRSWGFRLLYSGRGIDPHSIWVSAIDDINEYSLDAGGFSMFIEDGHGDPYGITGLSPVLRGEVFITKWASIHKLYNTNYGIGVSTVTSEVGCVHHNAMAAIPNDIHFVSSSAIHSLALTMQYGADEQTTITWPIYEYFQESIHWDNASKMSMIYDQQTNTMLLAHTSGGASKNNKILGYNVRSREFFEWEDCYYPVLSKYYDFGRPKVLVVCDLKGLCLLDDSFSTLGGITDQEGDPIKMELETGVIFPMGAPNIGVTFTGGWIVVKPTDFSVPIEVSYKLDDGQSIVLEVDSLADGSGALVSDDMTIAGIIGIDKIGFTNKAYKVIPLKINGEANSIRFSIKQEPLAENAVNPCEIYGIIYEFGYNGDLEETKQN